MSSSVISSCRETDKLVYTGTLAPEAAPVSIHLNSPPVFDWYSLHLLNQRRSDRPFLCNTQEIRGRFNNVALCTQRGGAETTQTGHLLCLGLFLREDPEDKVGLFVGLKGGGDDQVLSGGQAETCAHLSQVDESLRACTWWVPQKEVLLQVDILATFVLRVGEDAFAYLDKLLLWITSFLKNLITNVGVSKIYPVYPFSMWRYDHQSLVLIDVVFTSSGICKKQKGNEWEWVLLWTETPKDSVTLRFRSYFVHGEADGVHVLTLTPISTAVLLHESH